MNIAPESSVRFMTRPVGQGPAPGEARRGVVLHTVGSRSDAVRLAPVIAALGATGVAQAVARPVAGDGDAPLVFDPAGLPLTERLVDPTTDSPSERTARTLSAFEAMLVVEQPSLLVIAGDGDATLACGLAATKLGVPVVRLGGGLRCHDWSLSEEINRVLTDRLADLLLVDSAEAADALESEGILGSRVHCVGSTVVDSVHRWEPAARRRETWRTLGLPCGGYVLATLHRPENVEFDERLARITEGLAALAERLPVVFPMHPRTAAVMTPMGDVERLRRAGVRVTEPLDYLDFLSLQSAAGAILTDSGCVQEEASALGVRCYTLRRATERNVTLTHGTNMLLGDDPAEITAIECGESTLAPAAIPFWDGRAAARVATALSGRFLLPAAA
jgi:UDP-N-acetylglucosamine 2-epimerase (non-hydrolysing)